MRTKGLRLLAALFVLLSIFTINVFGQEEQKLVKIETKDGNSFIGFIINETDEIVVLKTETFGDITLKKSTIKKITEIEANKIKDGELWEDNPQSTRYLWTPNGYGLKEGEGYYQNIWVLYNQFSYGFSDYFSFSAGVIPLFLFSAGFTPVWAVPKFSIPIVKDKVNLSAGAFLGTLLGEDNSNFGIVFSTLTLGDRNKNINFGLGWGYMEDEWSDNPIINVSGMIRLSPRGYFLTENYFFPIEDESLGLLSLGYRHMIRTVGLDFGLYLPISSEVSDFVAIPIVGITLPLNGKSKK
jgi:hypothetical protein